MSCGTPQIVSGPLGERPKFRDETENPRDNRVFQGTENLGCKGADVLSLLLSRMKTRNNSSKFLNFDIFGYRKNGSLPVFLATVPRNYTEPVKCFQKVYTKIKF